MLQLNDTMTAMEALAALKMTGHFLMQFSHKYFSETVQLIHSNNNIRRIYTKKAEHHNAIHQAIF